MCITECLECETDTTITPGDILTVAFAVEVQSSYNLFVNVNVSGEVDIWVRCANGSVFTVSIGIPCTRFDFFCTDLVRASASIAAPDICGNHSSYRILDDGSTPVATFNARVTVDNPSVNVRIAFEFAVNGHGAWSAWADANAEPPCDGVPVCEECEFVSESGSGVSTTAIVASSTSCFGALVIACACAKYACCRRRVTNCCCKNKARAIAARRRKRRKVAAASPTDQNVALSYV